MPSKMSKPTMMVDTEPKSGTLMLVDTVRSTILSLSYLFEDITPL
jgi:hypothetical protein